MPWMETSAMREREQFFREWEQDERAGRLNFAALCRSFGISRQSGRNGCVGIWPRQAEPSRWRIVPVDRSRRRRRWTTTSSTCSSRHARSVRGGGR